MSMWKLSPEAEQDAQELRERMRSFAQQVAPRKTAELIERLVKRNETAAIPAVASGLFSPASAIHDAASTGLSILLKAVPSLELIRLNELLGNYYSGYVSERWDRIKPKTVESYLSQTNDVSVGSLLSLHKNGYVRHAAIRFLTGVETGEELRFLLLRQNDWVNSISKEVQLSVRSKLRPDYLSHFADESDLLFHTLKFKRRDLSEIVSSYVDLLVVPEHRSLLLHAIDSCGKQANRMLLGKLLDRDGDHLAETVRAGLASSDGVTRTNCLKRVQGCLTKDECNSIADKLLSDKFISVRQEAYELKASLSIDSENVWKQCMLDKSRALRETAIFYLRKAKHDVSSIYRAKLSSEPYSLPALSGLVTCADASDLEVFISYLKSPWASRRAEAVQGVGRVGGKAEVFQLQEMLLDESTRVVRATHQQLQSIATTIDSDSLFDMLGKCKSPAGNSAILRLLMEKGRWSSLSYLIRSAASTDQSLAYQAMALLDYTFSQNRVFTQPSLAQRKKIQLAIDESRTSIDAAFFRTVSRWLSSFGFILPT